MATQEYRIVAGEESDIHTEPHIQGSRITVRFVHELVAVADLEPEDVAEKYNLDIADVYEGLAYYHTNPAEMRDVEQRHREAVREANRRISVTPPDPTETDGVSVELDENIEHEEFHRLENDGHDVEHVDFVPTLGNSLSANRWHRSSCQLELS